jgi:hypothetical protein
MLWTGTSASHVDLHPGIGYDNSYAAAAGGGKQVGWGHLKGGFTHALLWSGTADSIVDLHSLLPAPVGALFNSFAISIDANGNIFGIADDFGGNVYAVEWSLRQAKLVNTSTRLRVLTGSNVLISGFILSGSGTKSMLLRGLGPTLTQFGVADALADPTLQLQTSNGPLLASNNN